MPTESAKTSDIRTFSRTREPEWAIAKLADRQYGVVGRDQLIRLGFEEGAIGRRVRAGRLHRLHAGVYSVGHRVIPKQGRWLAAVLASGDGAVLSHWSAAALWTIRPNSRTRVDVTVSHRSRSSKLIHRHISVIPADERIVEGGIPATTVPRTIFDLAATEPVDVVKAMLKESEYRNLYDRLSLWDLVERYPGRRGVRRVRVVLEGRRLHRPGPKRSIGRGVHDTA